MYFQIISKPPGADPTVWVEIRHHLEAWNQGFGDRDMMTRLVSQQFRAQKHQWRPIGQSLGFASLKFFLDHGQVFVYRSGFPLKGANDRVALPVSDFKGVNTDRRTISPTHPLR